MPDSKFFEQGELNALRIAQAARTQDLDSHGTDYEPRAFHLFNNAIAYLLGMHPVSNPRLSISALGTRWERYMRYRDAWRTSFEQWKIR